jgi:hypothetical protein
MPATKTKTFTGFEVVCPFCGDADARISVDVNQLGDDNAIHCSACDWEGTPAEALAKAEEKASAWRKLVRWVEMASEIE